MSTLHGKDSWAQEPLIPTIFRLLNGAISNAHAEQDDRTVDLLLAAKMGAVRRHHELLAEGR